MPGTQAPISLEVLEPVPPKLTYPGSESAASKYRGVFEHLETPTHDEHFCVSVNYLYAFNKFIGGYIRFYSKASIQIFITLKGIVRYSKFQIRIGDHYSAIE